MGDIAILRKDRVTGYNEAIAAGNRVGTAEEKAERVAAYAIVDCNSFYCSCERLFRPDLAGKPVVVLSNNDGCIIARSDEAKALGIDMGLPYFMAKEQLEKHKVAVFSSNYSLYGNLSMRVMDCLRALMGEDKVEVYSVDEAFIEVDVPPENWEALGRMLKARVEQWTGIQVSVGIARSKVLSKLANRLSKKDKKGSGGVMTLRNEQDWERALRQTALSDLWGIGRRYGEKLREQWGMETAWQLAAMPESWAGKQLGGVNGIRLHRELRGLPSISLKDPLEKKKAIACTRMFGRPVNRLSEIKEAIAAYISRAAEKLRRQEAAACGIEVFLIHKEADGAARAYETGINKNCLQLPMPASSTGELIRRALPLAEAIFEPGRHYIKAGVQLFDLVPDQLLQGNLFEEGSGIRQAPLMKVMDNINFSMKAETVRFAASGTARSWKMRRELCSKAYTTSWKDLPELH